ncbi:toll/interleukin-1 receptor domain-containing protein [bacterium]|nr:toll/interleukin-1 receptor domain-containing protein [bacterium]
MDQKEDCHKKPSVFICHGSPDKNFAKRLAADLDKVGIFACYDEWEIKVCDSITGLIKEGIRKAEYFVVILSDDSVRRDWVQKELKTAMHLHDERNLKILPVLLTNCDIPPFIQELRYADFTISYNVGLRDLILAIEPSKAVNIKIINSQISVADKINWFFNEFSLEMLSEFSEIYSTGRRYRPHGDNQKVLDLIISEINEEWNFLRKSERYSEEAGVTHGSAVAYLRDYLYVRAIDPFKDMFDPYTNDEDSEVFKKAFLGGSVDFKAHLFVPLIKKYGFLLTVNKAFEFANESFKLQLIDKIISYFSRFSLFFIDGS